MFIFILSNFVNFIIQCYTEDSCGEEIEKMDGKEIIQTFFSTNSKEDVLNVIRMVSF